MWAATALLPAGPHTLKAKASHHPYHAPLFQGGPAESRKSGRRHGWTQLQQGGRSGLFGPHPTMTVTKQPPRAMWLERPHHSRMPASWACWNARVNVARSTLAIDQATFNFHAATGEADSEESPPAPSGHHTASTSTTPACQHGK